jgi:hypothetical protein
MTKLKYAKEDLIWEATRRNEGYKRLFKSNVDESTKTALARDFFGLNFLADPNLDIGKIKDNIASGADPKEAHPYHGFFEKNEKPVAQHKIPDFVYQYWDELYTSEQDDTSNIKKHQEQFETWFQPFLNQMSGRILISIDPECSDSEIFAGITEIKRKAVRKKKAAANEKQLSPRAYFPRDIGKYIGWLRMYDQIVTTAREMDLGLEADGPILTLPKDFPFRSVVPDEFMEDDKGPSFESVRRKYRDAYPEATNLIKSSPYISFSNARARK